MLLLWFVHRENYVWLLNKIFLPGCLNSIAGLIGTLINVYGQQEGVWSLTARITAIVTGSCTGVLGGLFAVYNFWVLEKVKEGHKRELGEWGGVGDEGVKEKIGRRINERPLEPESVV